MNDDTFRLTPQERHTALWARISGHLQEKLEIARGKNDGDADVAATAKLRGQIATLKALIALGDEEQIPE